MKKRMSASFSLTFPEAMGLSLVLLTWGSISLSAKSLRTQPAERIITTPSINITRIFIDTSPLLASQSDQSIGHIKSHIPMGLSSLINRNK